MLTVDDVVEALTQTRPGVDRPITGAVVDSREATRGSMFVAMKGKRTDGHDFVEDAFEHGAALALVEDVPDGNVRVVDLRGGKLKDSQAWEFPLRLRVNSTLDALQKAAAHWRDQIDVRVIGITGSVGKSTTKELTAEVLERRYRTLKNPGNLNNEIGLPLSLLRLTERHKRAVLEMGFYVPGEIALLCQIARPSVGVVTNISQVHLERAKTLDAIVQGKTELVESLPAAPEGVAILNNDDPLVKGMAERTEARVFTYGLSSDSDLWADDVVGLGLEGIRLILHYQGESIHVRVPLLGRHSVHTVLRASAVGLVEGLTWEEIVSGLQTTPSQLRLMAVTGPKGAILLDDTYNAAPASTIAALNLLDDLDGQKTAVLGDMLELGSFEERGHRMVGARAAEVVDQLITVGERAHWIAQEAIKAGLSEERVVEVDRPKQAIKYLKKHIGPDDVVLVKGSRGMHMDTIVNELEQRQ
ncbi:MAG: UDP-N-acetylmuramoyl-tripeptide--D-alanyl-D-alanine ligase [Anaerolineales bacterium]